AGHGVALMPRYAITHPGVSRKPVAGVRAARVYELATRLHIDRSPAIGVVLDAFRDVARAVGE
ncbi:LysR family transcriptional regulator, partial [Rhodococcus erythropolis]|nr:LysR family transcriptional regulator [Rhodococcus erythropolis]